MNERRPLSLEDQAALIEGLIFRCRLKDGALAGETHMTLSADDARDLDHLAMRLRRMAPHETAIKRLVTGR